MLSITYTGLRVRWVGVAMVLGLVSGLAMNTRAPAAERAMTLEQQLIELGWLSHQAPDGTVTLTPPAGKPNDEGKVETSPAHKSDNRFHEQLRNLGWGLEEAPDGTLIFSPPSTAQAQPQKDAPDPAVASDADSLDPTALAVEKLLSGPGWKVEKESDGTTRLIPAATLQAESVSKSGTQTIVASPTLATDIRRSLERQGWELRQNADGSVLIFPPATQKVDNESAQVHPVSLPAKENANRTSMAGKASTDCGWWIAAMVRDGSVKMPVDTWAEAQTIARSWVARQAESSLKAGKVRKILRIYLVSVVEDRPPFKLRHQLAIRADDGRLAVLY